MKSARLLHSKGCVASSTMILEQNEQDHTCENTSSETGFRLSGRSDSESLATRLENTGKTHYDKAREVYSQRESKSYLEISPQ